MIQNIVRAFCTIYNEQSVLTCELLLIGTCIINDIKKNKLLITTVEYWGLTLRIIFLYTKLHQLITSINTATLLEMPLKNHYKMSYRPKYYQIGTKEIHSMYMHV